MALIYVFKHFAVYSGITLGQLSTKHLTASSARLIRGKVNKTMSAILDFKWSTRLKHATLRTLMRISFLTPK